MASNSVYSATIATVTVLRVGKLSAMRKAINWSSFHVKTLALERKSGNTW